MPDNLSRAVINSLLPGGSLWKVAPDADLDKLFDGMADNAEAVAEFMETLSKVRDPYRTPYLADLEREYGISTDTRLTEARRRELLAGLMYNRGTAGTITSLQNALDTAGFDVTVYANDPAVDPRTWTSDRVAIMYAGGNNAYAGYIPGSFDQPVAGYAVGGGYLLVNGAQYEQKAAYLSQAGEMQASEFDTESYAGRYDELEQKLKTYTTPADPKSWPFFFFVGGDVVRDAAGHIIEIKPADVPGPEKTQFESLILKYKPLHCWAVIVVNFM